MMIGETITDIIILSDRKSPDLSKIRQLSLNFQGITIKDGETQKQIKSFLQFANMNIKSS